MPTYDYQCRSCGTVTEVIHPMAEDGPSVCEVCGGQLRRVLYPTGIIFKGSGFYSTDSRTGNTASSSATKPAADGSGSSSDAKPAGDGNKTTETKKAPTPAGDASA